MKSETKYIFSRGDLARQDFSIKYKNDKGNVVLKVSLKLEAHRVLLFLHIEK